MDERYVDTSSKDENAHGNIEKEKQIDISPLVASRKIKVFISSKCGNKKYDTVRAKLKKAIEDTRLADAYLFEAEGAATCTAGTHYKFALEDSDVCIFLIDNADGVTPGVQDEIDIVKKHSIKALYYFCDEKTKEKTMLEQSLMGAKFAKSSTVHRFDDLGRDGARALINDIINIYHYYCIGKLVINSEDESDFFQRVDVSRTEKIPQPTMPKAVLSNIDKCKEYILSFITGYAYGKPDVEQENTSEIDEWAVQFLPVLFEAKSIKQFNTGMFMDAIKSLQTEEYHKIVKMRWQAIQSYFSGEIKKCMEHLENVLKVAKESDQPIWVIKDILIDLRNQSMVYDTMQNTFSKSEAQKELTDSEDELYYPILDRVNESLYEKYIEGIYKKKIESPYTITFGSNLGPYGDLLASSYVVALYNGSLTHILLLYKRIKECLFYLCSKYDDWNLRRDMFKMAIYEGDKKEVDRIKETYPEVMNNLDAQDALAIMEFCNNHRVKYKKLNSQLIAFGAVGYFLSEEHFREYELLIVKEIKNLIKDENAVFILGQNIFKSLSGVALRLSQDDIVEICCLIMDRRDISWYRDMFNFINDRHNIDLKKMNRSSAKALIDHIIHVLENEDERNQLMHTPNFLYVLRQQDWELTETLDEKIAEYLPKYYNDRYKLETTKNEAQDLPKFIQYYLQRIQVNNETQGKNGVYYGRSSRDIAIIRKILIEGNFICDAKLVDSVVLTVAYTLLKSKEGIRDKLDAVSLLIYIAIKRSEDFKRNYGIYEQLMEKQEEIIAYENTMNNINDIALKISLQFLFCSMGVDTYLRILELMPYIQNDIATTISVIHIIVEYLELDDDVILPSKIESIVLQNTLHWSHSDNLEIRWNAVRILLAMLRNPENESIVNQQLIKNVDTDNLYIKNLILRNIYNTKGIFKSTKECVIAKCQNDANFVVRMVCAEEVEKNENKKG